MNAAAPPDLPGNRQVPGFFWLFSRSPILWGFLASGLMLFLVYLSLAAKHGQGEPRFLWLIFWWLSAGMVLGGLYAGMAWRISAHGIRVAGKVKLLDAGRVHVYRGWSEQGTWSFLSYHVGGRHFAIAQTVYAPIEKLHAPDLVELYVDTRWPRLHVRRGTAVIGLARADD